MKNCLMYGLAAIALLHCTAASAQPSPAAVPPSSLSHDISLRTRYELTDWFGPLDQKREYGFFHTKLQFGLGWNAAPYRVYIQGQHFQLYDLPRGAAGPGAVYFATNGDEHDPGYLSVRQVFAEYTAEAGQFLAGRSLYSNGSEAPPANAHLAAVRSKRVAQRIIGPFDFTGGRSFDGARGTLRAGEWGTLGAFYLLPTQGGFEAELLPTIDEISTGGISWTAPMHRVGDAFDDVQLFVYSYRDDRGIVKTDNRPPDVRGAETSDINLFTAGGHWMRRWETGSSHDIDALVWAVVQGGDWGEQDHRAGSFTAEAGLRPTDARGIGLRAGYTFGSGDDDPQDGDHETFFQMLPTGRAFAATPFYNMQNSEDLFLQLHWSPLEALTLRSEVHRLRLAEASDLFYAGSGANEQRNRFGFTGTPSGGSGDIGTLADIEATWTVSKHATVTAYYGHLFGGDVIEAAASDGDTDIDYFFVEFTLRG